MKRLILTALLFGAAQQAAAQDHTGHGEQGSGQAATASAASTLGYSAEERAAGLREGRGMGLALPAEGNGYPGPRHVLEMAGELSLSADQRAKTQGLFDQMLAGAKGLGHQLLAEEGELEALFRDKRATPASLEAAARRIGETEAALKVVHLRTHLAMMDILTPAQVARYVALRRSGAGTGRARPAADAQKPAGHNH
ncbi:MAG TPA: Spy/CpxP family protein refolding chaperone [Allosphingosinicella sp.]|uniref:Spy/CpxP family protein refolding chaperone n=1 Tax=Allosphingosinicella sp. TaxID=2823234 RepID=UPI002ED8540B